MVSIRHNNIYVILNTVSAIALAWREFKMVCLNNSTYKLVTPFEGRTTGLFEVFSGVLQG